MEENVDINTIVKKIKDSRNCGTEDSFVIMVSHILLNSGIQEYSSLHQIFYLSEIPLSQGILIVNKLEYLTKNRNSKLKNVTLLIEKLRFKFDISPEESEQIKYTMKSEFEFNHIPEYLKEHNEIDDDSFVLGFIACMTTCID